MNPVTTKHVKAFIRRPYAFPGGYPMYLVMDDGGALCKACARTEWPLICDSIRSNTADGWNVIAIDVNWEDPTLTCDHCSNPIEAAYCDSAPDEVVAKCDQCEELMIQGVRCHELGCPNMFKRLADAVKEITS